MVSAAALVDLGARYESLGLKVAARAALERARELEPDAAGPALCLAELCLATGDPQAARNAAAAGVRALGDAGARVVLARCDLAAGEVGAARRAAAGALELARDAHERARAHIVRADVAGAEADPQGERAHILAAFEALCGLAPEGSGAEEAAWAESLGIRAVEMGVDEEAEARAFEAAPRSLGAGLALAALYGARQARGDEVRDVDVDAQLSEILASWPESRPVRLRLAERMLRRRGADAKARAEALGRLEALAAEVEGDGRAGSEEGARVWLSLARARAGDPASAEGAGEAYRRALRYLPGHVAARVELAELLLGRGHLEGAAEELARALRIDPEHALAWRAAAALVKGRSLRDAEGGRAELLSSLCEEAEPGLGGTAGALADHLAAAAAEVARSEVLSGVHTRGHRLKNQLGVLGARARSASKRASEGPLADKLAALEREATAIYDEWAHYLRSTQAEGQVLEPVSIAALAHDVVGRVPGEVELFIEPGLPAVRGDRLLLEEALQCALQNALEAAGEGGRMTLAARRRASGGAAIVEIAVADEGPGIPQAELARVVSPGFTTKEGGSGLGLAVAERAAYAHHGRLFIDSEPGLGTRVTLALPCDVSELAGPRLRGGSGT